MEGREECKAECTEGEEGRMRRVRVEETGEERKEGLEERIRRLRCRVREALGLSDPLVRGLHL